MNAVQKLQSLIRNITRDAVEYLAVAQSPLATVQEQEAAYACAEARLLFARELLAQTDEVIEKAAKG